MVMIVVMVMIRWVMIDADDANDDDDGDDRGDGDDTLSDDRCWWC